MVDGRPGHRGVKSLRAVVGVKVCGGRSQAEATAHFMPSKQTKQKSIRRQLLNRASTTQQQARSCLFP